MPRRGHLRKKCNETHDWPPPPPSKKCFEPFRLLIAGSFLVWMTGCASLTNDPNQQVQFKAPGCRGMDLQCTARNKRGSWNFTPPETLPIRRSDDVLSITCTDRDGGVHAESVPSRIGGKIVASAVFLDFGITDAITDKHREYPPQIVLSACE